MTVDASVPMPRVLMKVSPLTLVPSVVHLAHILTASGWKRRCLLRLVMIMRPVLLPLQTARGVQIQMRKGQVLTTVCPIPEAQLLASIA